MFKKDTSDSLQSQNKKSKNKKIKRIILSLLLTLSTLLAGAAIYVNSLLDYIDIETYSPSDNDIIYEPSYPPGETESEVPAPTTEPTAEPTAIPSTPTPDDNEPNIYNLLVFGLDNRSPDETSRSDSIIIATLDKDKDKIKLTSLMRDMYVTIPGRKLNDRINTGYFFGGPALALKTVNTNFNMNIKDYIAIDFCGFEAVIDKLNGVEVTITEDEAKIIGSRKSGTCNLNGKQALAYARIRKIGADFERTSRQRKVLNALLKKAKSVPVYRIPGILNTLLPHIRTNLSKAEILKLCYQVTATKTEKVEELRIPVQGAYTNEKIRGMDVLVPDLEQNTEVLHAFIYNQ